ncbi:hypothetical protein [Thalassovita taeanensis]|uniref:hypothetical protein n=1 Tax=Thalassovita taeanensis TaxID=657014 RepID=UPI001114A6F8|nr:hypothetical protein [Thalassovita taeanensis]
MSTDISACQGGLGPLSIALGLLGVSDEGVTPKKWQNIQPEGGIEALLELNRSNRSDDELAAAKRAYLDQMRK